MGSILLFRMEKNNSPSGIARKHTAQTLPSVTGFVVKLWMNAFLENILSGLENVYYNQSCQKRDKVYSINIYILKSQLLKIMYKEN